jgi:hypothetical protein
MVRVSETRSSPSPKTPCDSFDSSQEESQRMISDPSHGLRRYTEPKSLEVACLASESNRCSPLPAGTD